MRRKPVCSGGGMRAEEQEGAWEGTVQAEGTASSQPRAGSGGYLAPPRNCRAPEAGMQPAGEGWHREVRGRQAGATSAGPGVTTRSFRPNSQCSGDIRSTGVIDSDRYLLKYKPGRMNCGGRKGRQVGEEAV